jgi:hypothetical protein
LTRLWAIVRSRVRLVLAVAVSRVRAGVTRLRLRRETERLSAERARCLQALGDAVYRDDAGAVERIRMQIGELERRMSVVRDELRTVERRTGERIARALVESGPTDIVEPPPGAPEPPIVPEPEPVPHEPPGPVIVPEPEPVPHEPPGPVIVPEPGPPTD